MTPRRIQLIRDWRLAWRFWSVRLQALGAALLAFSLAAPDYAIQALAILPVDIRAGIAPELIQYVALASVVAGIIARYIKQQRLADEAAALGRESDARLPVPPQTDSFRVADGAGLDDVVHGIRERRDI